MGKRPQRSSKTRIRGWGLSMAALFVAFAAVPIAGAADDMLSPKEELGKSIFFDENLSINKNQSCATCHAPEAGWTGPTSEINAAGAVYEGSILGRFGNRKPPSSAYATPAPILFPDKRGTFVGGNFWDGRATGEKLGNPAADQAQGPFLNPLEQALPTSACVVYRVTQGDYGTLFMNVWGDTSAGITWPTDIETECAEEDGTVSLSDADWALSMQAYDQIALSIAAYEDSAEVNAYTSKFDAWKAEEVSLTKEEVRGWALFNGKGKCAKCHIPRGENALFTDFTYDNLGIPRNPENPFYEQDEFNPDGFDWIDLGLGGFLASRPEWEDLAADLEGAHKVPTLRNVDLRPDSGFVKDFGHNGYFKSLEGIVHFYNTRDVKPTCEDEWATEAEALAANCWPAPEVAENVNQEELGDLGLTAEEEAAIVAFLRTLSDGYMP